jgi:hypothetical protein
MKRNHFLFTLSIHIRANKIPWNWQLKLKKKDWSAFMLQQYFLFIPDIT